MALVERELTYSEFKQFIQNYFNLDSDETFYRRLFDAFDNDHSSTISFREMVVGASILESGAPEQKLEFLFKVYDENEDGFLDRSELETILLQMSAVAAGLGLDTAEMLASLKAMLKGLDTENEGRISRQQWIDGGMRMAPLLIALGLDQGAYNQQKIREGVHRWYFKARHAGGGGGVGAHR